MGKRRKRSSGRGAATILGGVSFAFALLAVYWWYSASRPMNPAQMRHLRGQVREVAYRKDRYGHVERIHFFLDDDRAELVYPSFYPDFDSAARCIRGGAAIDLELDAGADEILSLRCNQTLIASAAGVAAARRENGRAALYLAGLFLGATAACVWLFLAAGAAASPRERPRRRKSGREPSVTPRASSPPRHPSRRD